LHIAVHLEQTGRVINKGTDVDSWHLVNPGD
jgi:hypothetical protein